MKFFFAYLDPGSGSALVGAVIAIAGAALYSLKSLLYLILRKEVNKEPVETEIAIFSEGKNYWETFRLIVETLVKRKVHFSYYTLDLHDPALLIESEYMHSRLLDKNKLLTPYRFSKICAKVLLSTTPNIGTKGFPLPRPNSVGKLIHVFHAFADISAYHIGSLDCYDTVLTVGPHQDKYIREVEFARGLPAKELIPIGLPYFDVQYLSRTAIPKKNETKKTILIAPSWGAKGCLNEYGYEFVLQLAAAGYEIILRPHPQSLLVERAFIERMKKQMESIPTIHWDFAVVGKAAMEASDLLISDTSSIRFDYAFLYEKPVLTLQIPQESQKEYEGAYMAERWTDVAEKHIGAVLNHETISTIVDEVKRIFDLKTTQAVTQFRDETVTNLGSSAQAIVDVLVKECEVTHV